MIRADWTATHFCDGRQVIALDRCSDYEDPAEELPKEITEVLGLGFRPAVAAGEEVHFKMHGLRHNVLGISTHNIRPRTIRRILERLWPTDAEAPGIACQIAHRLVRDGSVVLRNSPYLGLVVSRD